MNWFRKVVEVEKVVVKTVLGTPKPVAMFRRYKYVGGYGGQATIAYYHSRQQAMEECEKYDKVEPAMLWRVGDTYLRDLAVVECVVKAEPKRKGQGMTTATTPQAVGEVSA